MKQNLFCLLTLAALLAGCAGPAAVATGSAPGAASPVPTESLAPASLLTEAPASASADTFVISEDFVPSDPATVSLAAGRPQLVEFFAFW